MIPDTLNYLSFGFLCKPPSPCSSANVLVKQISKCQASKTLLDEAQKALKELGLANLEVHLQQTKSGFRAETQGNIIRIKPELPASEQIGLLVFELTNVIQLKKHLEVIKLVATDVLKSSEEYIIAEEKIEYDGWKLARTVNRALNNHKGSIFRPYAKLNSEYMPIERLGFDFHYNWHLENKHKAHYHNNWHSIRQHFNLPTDNKPWIPKANPKLEIIIKCGYAFCAGAILLNLYKLNKSISPILN